MNDSKYYSLYQEIKNDIIGGKYPPKSKIPSKRQMCVITGYSLITVQKAYDMLTEEGYILPELRRGYYVADAAFLPFDKEKPHKCTYRHLVLPEKKYTADFSYHLWFKTVRKVMTDYDGLLFRKSPNKGCEILRNAIADYLLHYRGMAVNPAAIIIGSGAEQLYDTVVKLLGRDKIYAVESPCYRQIENVYAISDVLLCRLKMGNDGIEERELNEKVFDVLHVTPFHSYPTGVSTSIAKKLKYLARAQKTGGTVIEDDFDSEFFAPGQPIQTLFSLDTHGCVIYMNTFSKSISPAVRIGYMILPDSLMQRYDEKLGGLSCSVPVMDQYVLAEFIASGSFERHLNRARRYQCRDTPVADICQEFFPSVK